MSDNIIQLAFTGFCAILFGIGLQILYTGPYRRWRGKQDLQDPYIFHYTDGIRERTADPIVIEHSLSESLGEDWRKKVDFLDKPLPPGMMGDAATEAIAEHAQLRKDILDAINRAFDVHDYIGIGWLDTDGDVTTRPSGLIEPRRRGLLNGYRLFCIDLVRAARPFGKQQSRASPTIVNPTPPSAQVSTSVDENSARPEIDSSVNLSLVP